MQQTTMVKPVTQLITNSQLADARHILYALI